MVLHLFPKALVPENDNHRRISGTRTYCLFSHEPIEPITCSPLHLLAEHGEDGHVTQPWGEFATPRDESERYTQPPTMLFVFGFSGADISDAETPAVSANTPENNEPQAAEKNAVVPPKSHALADVLQSLTDVRLTFDNYETPNGNVVYRRQLFDIKHQVMTEEDEAVNVVHDILMGNAADEADVRKDVYEGGFKLWECSYDLVDKLHTLHENRETQKHKCLLELGCGTALPTCYLLMLLFRSPPLVSQPSTFVFSDFNYEVLRLVTLPNILIHYASTLSPEALRELSNPEIPLNNDELLLTPSFIEKFTSDLETRGFHLYFVSGSWGTDFLSVVSPFSPDLVLTSETIYSCESLPLVLDILVSLFAGKYTYLGLVAAKQYYFGVGGSIREFLEDLRSKKPDGMLVETTSAGLGQLKRDIVQFRPAHS